jgi:hypothetical protein
LCKQRKVTRSQGCERKNEGMRSEQNQKPQQKLDSSLTSRPAVESRWNDEQKSKDTGFRLPPE